MADTFSIEAGLVMSQAHALQSSQWHEQRLETSLLYRQRESDAKAAMLMARRRAYAYLDGSERMRVMSHRTT